MRINNTGGVKWRLAALGFTVVTLCLFLITRGRNEPADRHLGLVTHNNAPSKVAVSEQLPNRKGAPVQAVSSMHNNLSGNMPHTNLDDMVPAIQEFIQGRKPLDEDLACRFLAGRTPPDGLQMAGIKDELLDRFKKMPSLPEGFLLRLAAIVGDPSADPAGRDYIMQYFREFYADRAKTDTWIAGSEAAGIRAAWSNALYGIDTKLAGTALLAWQAMSENHPEFDPAVVSAAALRLLHAPDTTDPARTAALAVCGHAHITEVLPEAMRVAEQGRTLTVRAAAIAALGELGGSSTIAWLETFKRKAAPAPLYPACDAALAKMGRRLAQSGK